MPTSDYLTGGWVPYSTSATYTVSNGWAEIATTASNEPEYIAASDGPGWFSWSQKNWQVIQDFIAHHNKQKSDPEEQDIVDLLD